MLKTIRTAVRLRHSIAADEELNEILPRASAKFFKKVQSGEIPDALDIKKLTNGY
jgi:hypothetical protein